jgi:hypothetical protein
MVASERQARCGLYVQGWILRKSVPSSASPRPPSANQLRRARVTMRRGAPAHDVSTDQILQLRDQGLSWTEVAD